jgi:serine/threonine protein kinase
MKRTLKNYNNKPINKKTNNRKTHGKKGGNRYGQGMKGFTIDLCNHKKRDQQNFCRQIKLENIQSVVLYLQDQTKKPNDLKTRILTPTETKDFFDFINHDTASEKYIVKDFYNPIGNKTDFENEIKGFRHISNILASEENAVGMPYHTDFVVGFSIEEKPTAFTLLENEMTYLLENNVFKNPIQTSKQYFVINRRCEQLLTFPFLNALTPQKFQQFVVDILHILVKLNRNNMVHADIKHDNMMFCNGRFILIDWELSQKYTKNWFQKPGLLPAWPMFYMLKFGKMAGKTMYSTIKSMFIHMFQAEDHIKPNESTYVETSLYYYYSLFEKMSASHIEEKVKSTFDLYHFGLVLYGVLQHNPILQSSPKYTRYLDFVNQIYRFKNPQTALRKFMSII